MKFRRRMEWDVILVLIALVSYWVAAIAIVALAFVRNCHPEP